MELDSGFIALIGGIAFAVFAVIKAILSGKKDDVVDIVIEDAKHDIEESQKVVEDHEAAITVIETDLRETTNEHKEAGIDDLDDFFTKRGL